MIFNKEIIKNSGPVRYAFERKEFFIEGAVVFVILFAIFVSSGFRYWPQLDDYIQYDDYASMWSASYPTVFAFIKDIGLLSARPLAGLLDLFLWSHFWGCMLIPCILLAGMYSVSEVLIRRIFGRYFGTGYIFTVIYCLLPVSMEGLYWISASTRIVCGMFFAALALTFFDKLQNRFTVRYLVLYLVFQFVGYCFYEQTLAVSVIVIIISMLFYRKKISLTGFSFIPAAGLYFLITKLAGQSVLYSDRGKVSLPFLDPNYRANTYDKAYEQYSRILVNANTRIFSRGLKRYFSDILSARAIIFTLIILLICACAGFLLYKQQKKVSSGKITRPGIVRILIEIPAGLLLLVAAASPYFILEFPYIALRAAVPCLAGIALIADGLIRLITFDNKTIAACLALTGTFLFSLVASVDISDYKQTYLNDTAIMSAIVETVPYTDPKMKIGIINLNETYLTEPTYDYKEHIQGVTFSEWSLSGAYASTTGVKFLPHITPIPIHGDIWYHYWDKEAKQLENFDLLYYYDEACNSLTKLEISERTEDRGGYYLIDENGDRFGEAYEREDGHGIIEIFK